MLQQEWRYRGVKGAGRRVKGDWQPVSSKAGIKSVSVINLTSL